MSIFFSYNRKDQAIVEGVKKLFVEKGYDVFMDAYSIDSGEDWLHSIAQNLKKCKAAIIFISPHGEGPWQKKEILSLDDKFSLDHTDKIIPLLFNMKHHQVSNAVPWYIRDKNWIEFADIKEKTDYAYQKLWTRLEDVFKETSVKRPVLTSKNPYKGLNSYEIEDNAIFYGRQNDLNRVFSEKLRLHYSIKNNNFLAIVANSGCGKSSFVRAGILARIQNGAFKASKNWKIIEMKPGSDPLGNLSSLLVKSGFLTIDSRTFEEEILKHNDSLLRKFREQDEVWILYIDQFEELIAQCKEEQVRSAFLQNIAKAIESEKLIVLISLRSDYYASFSNYFEFKSLLEKNNYTLPDIELGGGEDHRNEQIVREIICMPANNAGVELDAALVANILEQLKQVKGILPIIQLCMYKLWEEKGAREQSIENNLFNKIGESKGLSGIIENHIESKFAELSQGNKRKEKLIELLFVLYLIEVTSISEDVRKTADLEKIKIKGYTQDEIRKMIDLLSSGEVGILKISKALDTHRVELVHEVIIRSWKRLKDWISNKREALKYRNRILQDVQDFYTQTSPIYGSKDLNRAEKWGKSNPELLTQDIVDFLSKAKKHKLQNIAKLSLVFTCLLVLVLGYFFKIKPTSDFENNAIIKPQLAAIGYVPDSLTYLEVNDELSLQVLINHYRFWPKYKQPDSLLIENVDSLKDLKSIKALKYVTYIDLDYNPNLRNLEGIEKLTNLNSLVISSNPYLENLNGIEKLTNLSSLVVEYNENLENLNGIEAITNLTSLEITGNGNLENLNGIEKFKNLTSLLINGIYNLKNLNGIEELTNLTSLVIVYNENLKNINGIEELTNLTSLAISDNHKFTNLSAIKELKN